MIEELNYLCYYTSGFVLDKLSYSEKDSSKLKIKYRNKEEVVLPDWQSILLLLFYNKGGSKFGSIIS